MFISSIANETPSGYEPKILMSIVNRPHPIPNMIFPAGSVGDVTVVCSTEECTEHNAACADVENSSVQTAPDESQYEYCSYERYRDMR